MPNRFIDSSKKLFPTCSSLLSAPAPPTFLNNTRWTTWSSLLPTSSLSTLLHLQSYMGVGKDIFRKRQVYCRDNQGRFTKKYLLGLERCPGFFWQKGLEFFGSHPWLFLQILVSFFYTLQHFLLLLSHLTHTFIGVILHQSNYKPLEGRNHFLFSSVTL